MFPSPQTNLKLTVHDFVAPDAALSSREKVQLAQARQMCSNNTRWVAPQSTTDPSTFTLRRDKLYQYRFSPPSSTTSIGSTAIPEWGQPSHPGDPDHFRLLDLHDFECTDLLMHPRIKEAQPPRLGKRIHGGTTTVCEPAKRPRLDNSSILNLIPQPHFIPAPAANYQPVDTKKIPYYRKALPLPVAPHNTAAVNELLGSRYRRGAWFIPVRGSLPWNNVSTAVILEGTQVASRSPSPCLPVPAAQPRAIVWTPDTLQHFWTFLVSIQRARHLGPLSLSFHAAPPGAFAVTSSEPVWESNHPYYSQYSSRHATASSDVFAADIYRAQLEAIDYIKVYHDVPYSLSLRNILDAYRYEQADGQVPGRSGANDRKIRILKGVRLVFMDERSKAAFLM